MANRNSIRNYRCRGLLTTPNAILRKPIALNVNACGPKSPIRCRLKPETKSVPSARQTERSEDITQSLETFIKINSGASPEARNERSQYFPKDKIADGAGCKGPR